MSELTNRSVGDGKPGGGGAAGPSGGAPGPSGGAPEQADGAAAQAFAWTRRHTVALLVLCLAALLDSIDVTVVNVAMPAIKESLRFSESGLA